MPEGRLKMSCPLCQCGCGIPTLWSSRYKRFRAFAGPGHCSRLRAAKSYRRLGKHAMAHRVRAERALGHPLPPKAEVHHADGSKLVDAPLVICQDRWYHKLLHVRMRVKAAGGNPNTDAVCSVCRCAKSKTQFSPSRSRKLTGVHHECRTCKNAQSRMRRAMKKAAA